MGRCCAYRAHEGDASGKDQRQQSTSSESKRIDIHHRGRYGHVGQKTGHWKRITQYDTKQLLHGW